MTKQLKKSWVVLSMITCLAFAVCDISIGQLTEVGLISIFYFALGSFIISTSYWLVTFVFAKNRHLRADGSRRILIHDENGVFDPKRLMCFLLGGIVTGMRYVAVCLTFMLSVKANLNIGIAMTIWATAPFFSALLDFLIFKKRLAKSHLIGISFMLVCALLNAISEFIKPVSLED